MAVVKKEFGKNSKGELAHLYEITNAAGMKAIVTDFGATLHSLYVPDKDGQLRDVVWGYDTVKEYEIDNGPFFGATVGRIANRVGGAMVTINGVDYQMPVNERTNCLHSGPECYHVRMWDTEILENAVKFSILSPDGDQGLPGNFNVSVIYTLTEDNGLKITYDGISDKDTYVSMTNHSYFNLNGEKSDSILEHELWIDADAFTRVSNEMISTGEILDVTGTAMDFRIPKAIGRDINNEEEPLMIGGGYDHNWVINEHAAEKAIVKITSAESGIAMEVFTDYPGIQIYTGNFLCDKPGKRGRIYPNRSGVAFETQQFPDAMHHENFPSALVKEGEKFHTETEYKFSVK
ncbi:MAG: aldose epimerase family protein [Lachnospiraceae bacterium]|nr:aldose epimerase family protein [Lachnospiraceae bacterium]